MDEDKGETNIDCGGETCRPCGKFFITSEIVLLKKSLGIPKIFDF